MFRPPRAQADAEAGCVSPRRARRERSCSIEEQVRCHARADRNTRKTPCCRMGFRSSVSGWAAVACEVCSDLPAGELSRNRRSLVGDALRKLQVLFVQSRFRLCDESLRRVVLRPRLAIERTVVNPVQIGVGARERRANRPLQLTFRIRGRRLQRRRRCCRPQIFGRLRRFRWRRFRLGGVGLRRLRPLRLTRRRRRPRPLRRIPRRFSYERDRRRWLAVVDLDFPRRRRRYVERLIRRDLRLRARTRGERAGAGKAERQEGGKAEMEGRTAGRKGA